jgi:hypothetical protein
LLADQNKRESITKRKRKGASIDKMFAVPYSTIRKEKNMKMQGKQVRTIAAAFVATLALSQTAIAGELVASIVKAPITPDGDVAYARTDFVINFDRSMDPDVYGRTLLAGKTIRITLPGEFINMGGPVKLPGPPPDNCPPPAGTCSTGVLLQGWPQRPIPPSPANYTIGLDGTHTIVYTATRDLVPGDMSLTGPGLKQAHLILQSFMNPNPGTYPILVEAETGPGGALETGIGRLTIYPDERASINVTSVFVGAAPTIFQDTMVGEEIPLPWNFLMWDRNGMPAVGVEIKQISDRQAVLMMRHRVVGRIRISTPPGASGQQVMSDGPSVEITGPVLGLQTGRLTASFIAGNAPGRYTISLRMNNGTSAEMYVDAWE